MILTHYSEVKEQQQERQYDYVMYEIILPLFGMESLDCYQVLGYENAIYDTRCASFRDSDPHRKKDNRKELLFSKRFALFYLSI
jgi:hypothetical protein